MHFTIEAISEFIYIENILLGLPSCLKKCVGIRNTEVSKLSPAFYSDISAWEQKNEVQLPEDLRLFYLASNGFLFRWVYTLGGDERNDFVGTIKINSIECLLPLYGYETCNEPSVKFHTNRYHIKLAIESKIFELESIPNRGHIVLVYLFPKYVPTIWLLTSNKNFFFLARDFATYLRMAVVHLGIPNWQFAYSPQGVPQWTENCFRILAPHLFPVNQSVENLNLEGWFVRDDDSFNVPTNKLNPNLFNLHSHNAISAPIKDIKKHFRKKKTNLQRNRKSS